jgi:hypothetical protein
MPLRLKTPGVVSTEISGATLNGVTAVAGPPAFTAAASIL